MPGKHALFAASSTYRRELCAGSLALETRLAGGHESIHSARGTAAHKVIEQSLANNLDPNAYAGDVIRTDEHQIEVDEKIVVGASMMTDYCRSLIKPDTEWYSERFLSLAAIDPPLESGGSADFIAWQPKERLLEVVDYKNGVAPIEVLRNSQARTYALGAWLNLPQWQPRLIRTTIVQPNASHEAGPIRSEDLRPSELVDWTHELIAIISRTLVAMRDFALAGDDPNKLDAWYQEYLRPGEEQCFFCSAKGACPALRRQALDLVELYFDDFAAPQIPPTRLADNAPHVLARDLEAIELLQDWIRARQALSHQLAEGGTEIPGWQLVERYGHRKWDEQDEATLLGLISQATGLPQDKLVNIKVKSPNQVEMLLGAKRKKAIAGLYSKPMIGHDLVRSFRRERTPATTLVEQFFIEGVK